MRIQINLLPVLLILAAALLGIPAYVAHSIFLQAVSTLLFVAGLSLLIADNIRI